MRARWLVSLVLWAGCGDDGGGSAGTTAATESEGTSTSGSASGDEASTGATSVDEASTSTSTSTSTSATASGSSESDGTSATTGGESDDGPSVTCEPGAKPGAAGSSDGVATSVGVTMNVRTPASYDPEVGHPLLVAFAPAGADAFATEGFTGLTEDAFAAGFVIVYVDHVSPMSVAIIEGLEPILDDVIASWCIDESRVFYSGHSDGGSISEALLALDTDLPRPRGAAPSAAGITGSTMMGIGCPGLPSPIMVIHGAADTLFPIADGFGRAAADVWAGCNGCVGDPVDDGTCVRWSGCTDDVPTLYCEHAGTHPQWPDLNAEMFAFFAEASG